MYEDLKGRYQSGCVTLFNDDCMKLLAATPDNYYQLCVVDPPYGIGENGDRNKSRGKLAIAKDYKAFAGGDISAPEPDYFLKLCAFQKTR